MSILLSEIIIIIYDIVMELGTIHVYRNHDHYGSFVCHFSISNGHRKLQWQVYLILFILFEQMRPTAVRKLVERLQA